MNGSPKSFVEHGEDAAPRTRMIAMGGAALVEGFALVGFEACRDATPERVEEVLADLVRNHENAFVLLEHDLAANGGPWLRRVLAEGGRIIVSEIPRLHHPEGYRPPVEALVESILGTRALEDSF